VPPVTAGLGWVRIVSISMANHARWSAHPGLMRWLASSRLDGGLAHLLQESRDDATRKALVQRMRDGSRAGSANMPKLLFQLAHH